MGEGTKRPANVKFLRPLRVLFLTHRLPYAPNRGDRIRAYHLLRLLASRHEVHLVSLLHDAEEHGHLGDLAGVAASVTGAVVPRLRNRVQAVVALAGSRPLTHVLLSSPEFRPAIDKVVANAPPDVVLAYCTGVASALFTAPLDTVPGVLDMVDVDSEKWSELAQTASYPMKWVYRREARTLSRFERNAAERAVATAVVSERERALAERVLGRPVIAVPNGVDIQSWAPPAGQVSRPEVVFCGVLNYEPNERGAIWLASEVWPLVKQQEPGARLRLVGMNPSPRVRALAASDSIEVTGAVPDVRPHVWQASAAVAPLWLARGTQNKVLEALAAGLPCVVTPAVLEGLPPVAREACLCRQDAAGFAEALIGLVRSPLGAEKRAAIGNSVKSLGWEGQLAPFLGLVEAARLGQA
jgi:sugar transferase (PEP-CTERM/EpsH1 system associated)